MKKLTSRARKAKHKPRETSQLETFFLRSGRKCSWVVRVGSNYRGLGRKAEDFGLDVGNNEAF